MAIVPWPPLSEKSGSSVTADDSPASMIRKVCPLRAGHDASLPNAVQSISVNPDPVFRYTNEIPRKSSSVPCMVGALRLSWPVDIAVKLNQTEAKYGPGHGPCEPSQ